MNSTPAEWIETACGFRNAIDRDLEVFIDDESGYRLVYQNDTLEWQLDHSCFTGRTASELHLIFDL